MYRRTDPSYQRVYLRALDDRDSPSRADATLLLTSFGLVFLRTKDPVFVRLVLPPRGFIASALSSVTCYIHLHQHFVRRFIGEQHNDREAETEHKVTIGC